MLEQIHKRPKNCILLSMHNLERTLSLVCFLVFKQEVSCGVHLCHISCILNLGTLLLQFFRFYDVFCSVRTKFYSSKVVKSLFFVPILLIFEPCLWVFVCQLQAQIVPFSSLKLACFELSWCRFRAQIVPVSSPRKYSFEPKSYRFRRSPNREPFEPCSCCYRALSYCVHS